MDEHVTDHHRIRLWAEDNGVRPCGMVDAMGAVVGLFLCPRGTEPEVALGEGLTLADLGWDVFFDVFERQQLELRTQDTGFELRQRDRHAA